MLQLCAAGGCVLSSFAPVTWMPSPERGLFPFLERVPATRELAYQRPLEPAHPCRDVLMRAISLHVLPRCFSLLLVQDWRQCGRLRLLCHPVRPRRVLGSRDSTSQRPTQTVMRERNLFRASLGKPMYNHRWRAAAAVPLGVSAGCPLVGVCPAAPPAPVWRSSRLVRFVRVLHNIPCGPLTRLSCFVFVSGFSCTKTALPGRSKPWMLGGQWPLPRPPRRATPPCRPSRVRRRSHVR